MEQSLPGPIYCTVIVTVIDFVVKEALPRLCFIRIWDTIIMTDAEYFLATTDLWVTVNLQFLHCQYLPVIPAGMLLWIEIVNYSINCENCDNLACNNRINHFSGFQ